MPRNNRPSLSAYLALDQVPEFEASDSISGYWRQLLEIYIAGHCNSFSLSEVHSTEQIKQIACFRDWQPETKDSVRILTEWDTPAAGRRSYVEELTQFALTLESIGRLMQPQFHYWSISSDSYPVDRLYFFADRELLVEAEPNELAILFYGLTPARRELLWAIQPSAVRAFDESRNWVATALTYTGDHLK